VLERRLLLVTGKGGTGKSALAASLAVAAGRRGMRVLALAMGPGAGLARHLGLPRLESARRRHGDVHAALVDPAAALDEYLHLKVRVPRFAAVSRIFAAVVDTVPGVHDTVMIGKVVFESTRPQWDLVVVDAPPTGQVRSFLAAPATIAALVPGGAVRDQAAWLQSVLADARHTGVVVVATPEELPVIEATSFRNEIEGTVAVAATVANKVLPAADFDAFAVATAPVSAAAEAGALHLALASRQHDHLEALHPDRVVPYLFGMHTPEETAARLADLWVRP
jgi:anion-transporting  ArsA/GET3 family ATPase